MKITPQILLTKLKCHVPPALQNNSTRISSLWAPAPLPMKGRAKLELGVFNQKALETFFN